MHPSFIVWQQFRDRCIETRLDVELFTTYVELLKTQEPLPASQIAQIFLAPREDNDNALDPRVARYVQTLLSLELFNVPTLLRGLWKVSSFRLQEEGRVQDKETENKKAEGGVDGKAGKVWLNSYTTEETMFYRITKYISSGAALRDLQETVELINACISWMETVISATHAAHQMLNLAPTRAAEMAAQHMALGTLVVSVVENTQVQHALGKRAVPKSVRGHLSKALGGFVPLVLQSSPQIAGRLEIFRTETLAAFESPEAKEPKGEADKDIEEILQGGLELRVDSMVVEEIPVVNTRIGLYVYLNSLGDIRSTIIDLILAAFDVLANATFRNERAESISILRSFLINKIPLLLSNLSSSLFPPLTSEYCITEALSQVDTTAFPTLSNMFDETSNGNMFSDSVRQDFCFACCLHGLIEESSIEQLLGDIPMQSLPAGGRYVKDELVQQCLSDPERAEGLIDELQNMDGNVGAVSQAITEVIARLCSNKETMSLKSLCSRLVQKSSALDVMLLFDKPTAFLQPICDLLDNWRYDEDQGEYQPVYEEFGSILLLVLSFTYRYNLSTIDLGIRSPESFVAKLLTRGHLSRKMEDMSDSEKQHLTGWIQGLFDNESGGLGDELMSSCPPQDFYLLVPTLFHETVLACSTRNLSDETLKGGLEYLVDTFLLPSLVPGITWLACHLWESRGDANAVLQILSALITNPASISNNTEASQMLNSILNIVAKNLEQSLRWLQRAEPSRQDVEPLLKTLRGNLGWERRGASDHTELESWSGSTGGGLIVSLKSTIVNLIQWGLNPALNSNPANFTNRQILVGVKMLGAKRVLSAIIDEVRSQTETGHGSVALDAACALVCAPDAASWDVGISIDVLGASAMPPQQRRLNLREALRLEAENAPKLHKTEPFLAETIVRLYRKVEAQLTMSQQAIDALGDLNSAIEAAGIDALAAEGLGGDAADLLGDPHGDLMQGLIGGGADDLLGFGSTGDLGDGLGF
ncbi:mediator complex subunit Med5 [Diplocarpon rosae]|nr:mediator complex subunit Med5 [Diplocarpon rosae]